MGPLGPGGRWVRTAGSDCWVRTAGPGRAPNGWRRWGAQDDTKRAGLGRALGAAVLAS